MHDRACRSALAVAPCAFSSSGRNVLAVAPCKFSTSPENLCGDRVCRSALAAARANFRVGRPTVSLFSACGSAGAWSVLRILFGIDDLLSVLGRWQRWRVERLENFAWNQRPSRCFGQVAALARGAS